MKREQKRASGRGSRGREGQESAALAVLGQRFARFRGAHRDGARIPPELRAAVMAALEQGAKQGEVLRVCKLSWSQVRSWKGGGPGGAVRVFAVEDAAEAPAALGEGDELQLRLGPWSVSVRLSGGGKRSAACCR
jgi:hypothetical protein